ncbi:hypothetical protein [Micromonospora avicenniae]|uniref:hypothetical protein n=1 Tax=Micromonospora avicenniae TaxID=1198245 RepID=UPI00097090CE|nr:hypothetical protein [Micromonospora avicenniae]
MSWLTRTRWILIGAALLALAVGGGPFVEWRWPQFADRSPLAANILAGAMLVPLELYVAGVLLTGWQDRRRRRQWQVAAAELTDAVGATWERLRDLLVYQYTVQDVTGPLSWIRDARESWEHLHRQEAARPGHDPWAERPTWQLVL